MLGFKSLGLNKDDVVITQSFTFGATVHSIVNARAKPWLFDIDKDSLSLDLNQLEKTLQKTFFKKAIHF